MIINQTEGRMLRRSISSSIGFSKLSPEAGVLFCMIIPHLNSHGKCNGGTGYIKDEVCPHIKYLNHEKITKCLTEITKYTKLKFFKRDGRWWIHSINFLKKHQKLRPDRLGRDLLPSYNGTPPKYSEVKTHKEEVEGEDKDKKEVIVPSGTKDWDALKNNALAKFKQVQNGG